MIEVKNVKPINKGPLVATCDVYLTQDKFTVKDVLVFQKSDSYWVKYCTKPFKNDLGEEKYREMGQPDETETDDYRHQIVAQVKKSLAAATPF